jgi:predicted metal-dependent hydrolase
VSRPRHEYSVRRSQRARRARLTVGGDGRAVVVLPRQAPLRDAERMVVEHADWLDRHLARLAARRASLEARQPLGQGRMLPVASVPVCVTELDEGLWRPARGRVEERPGQLLVHLGQDGRTVAQLLDPWLRERARDVITARVHALAPALAVRPGRISIRDQSSRWASASVSGALSFSWRLLLAPPFVLDAVVVHELAHLRVRGHDGRFWALVEQHAPRTPEARRWLREHAYELRAALD